MKKDRTALKGELIRPFRADNFFYIPPQGFTLGYNNPPRLGLCKRWDTPVKSEGNKYEKEHPN
ncbi:MAG: hypothetical protein GY749_47480 [Desulfobacteraceae bacterium]|nr:hypothetical protein [Desulfobacteraceae bacterium]